MAISVRPPSRGLFRLPGTPSGRVALAGLGLTLVLLFARVVLAPAMGLPLNYLIVFLVAALSGATALYAVAIRRERSLAVIATLVIGLGAGAWLLAESLGGSPSNVTSLGEADNGSTVTVAQGGGLMIQLPGNPTTGYSWETTIDNSGVLESTGSVYKPKSDALGSDGIYTFWFAASSPGRAVVTLNYQRPSEPDVAPLRTYTVTIVVR